MTTYEDLCDATLRYQLMPLVVPQLKTITLGGAVTGLGIESTALRSGMPHESVTEMEILTGDGQLVRATDDNEHADLFRGFPNSYGTLGYSLSLTIELEPVQPFVHIRHFPFCTAEACMDAIGQIAADGSFHGHRADFVDGTAFGPDELTSQSGPSATSRRGAATTPGSRFTTSRSGGTRRTSSPSTTTCGAGTPTGSGARDPSGCRNPWSGRFGRVATGARTSTASWSPWTTAMASSISERTAEPPPDGRGSSRTWRSRSNVVPSSYDFSRKRWEWSGVDVPAAAARRADLAPIPYGRARCT